MVLYGPPGTGKTTWVRHATRKYLVSNGVVQGVYLELTPGDFASKWAGVPAQVMRCALDLVSRAHSRLPCVVLFDEADAMLTRPSGAATDITLERLVLVSEFKSAIASLAGYRGYSVIAMTTNFKNAIVETDPAVADRVTAWVEVPPPPVEVRESVLASKIHSAVARAWVSAPALVQALAAASISKSGSPPLVRGRPPARMTYVAPVLPFEADFVAGYLVAWGWNPLEKSIGRLLELDPVTGCSTWRRDSPVYRVYALGLLSQVEMYTKYLEKRHGVQKSFFRLLGSVKRGVDDLGSALSLYGRYWSWRSNKPEYYSRTLLGALLHHIVPPSLLHHMVAKYTSDQDFVVMVNDVLATGALITNGIRWLYVPFLFTAWGDDPVDCALELKARLGDYNRFVKAELESGRLLEPVRVLLKEPTPEIAWRDALGAYDALDRDVKPYVALALIGTWISHRAVHAKTVEEKGLALYETYRDHEALKEATIKLAKQLEVEEWIPAILKGRYSMHGGIVLIEPKPTKWACDDPSLFYMDYLDVQPETLELSTVSLFSSLHTYVTRAVWKIEDLLVEQSKK